MGKRELRWLLRGHLAGLIIKEKHNHSDLPDAAEFHPDLEDIFIEECDRAVRLLVPNAAPLHLPKDPS